MPRHIQRFRRGHTLLELVMSTALMAAILVPALAYLRQAMELSRRADVMQMASTHCLGKMEEQLALAAASFTDATASGTITVDAQTTLRYSVSRSTAPASGGIADRLMVVSASVWQDLNGNAVADANEPKAAFHTKVAKMSLYQAEAGGS